ncbi:MAG: general secretion pathway protein GspK, partial [Planctomycetes bacterium]|nr:general secretion pathway protein GspK [Planctomycetota bacterium]
MRERGSALIVVLWCVVVLSTIAYSSLRVARLDLRVAKNYGDRVQARYLAIAGLEKAKAMIHDVRTRENGLGTQGDRDLYDNPDQFRDVELGRGKYRVFRSRRPDDRSGEDLVYGLTDEERFLDINRADLAEIQKLPDMDVSVAASIVDWRDADSNESEGGAEAFAYESRRPPAWIRNGPIETMRELLLVQGVQPENFLGEDHDADGLLSPSERDGEASFPSDNGDSILDAGWIQFVSLETGVRDLDRFGEPRVDLAYATAEDLAAIDGIDMELAEAIVEWREFRGLESVADLLDVQALEENPDANANNGNGGNNDGNANNGGNNGDNSGGNGNTEANGNGDNGNGDN